MPLVTVSDDYKPKADGRQPVLVFSAHSKPMGLVVDEIIDIVEETLSVELGTDRPGMIGRIGSTLGAADVNIGAMHLARSAPREDALMILALDDDVPDEVARQIRDTEALIDLWPIRLGGER